LPEHRGSVAFFVRMPTHGYCHHFTGEIVQTTTSPTLEHAKRIWDYLASFSRPGKSDAIVVCCSYDLRVCDYACDLLRNSLASTILFTGNTGNWTRHFWDRPESHVFRERACANGIDASQVLIEDHAGNIAENIAFSQRIIPDAKRVTFVTKPNTLLRVKLTAPLQWPEVVSHTAGPDFKFPDDVSNTIGVFGVIHEMVGDIHRILEYPKLGFQVEHDLPAAVLDSWNRLVEKGFTQHMLKAS
jgi:uncharacterized SAM-binding protein YcdF (DUF218 family)